jgi:hypothetical protein
MVLGPMAQQAAGDTLSTSSGYRLQQAGISWWLMILGSDQVGIGSGVQTSAALC